MLVGGGKATAPPSSYPAPCGTPCRALQAAYAAFILRGTDIPPAFMAYLASYLGAMILMAATRTPRRREAQALLLSLCTFLPPFWSDESVRMLNTLLPEAGSSAAHAVQAVKLVMLALYASGAMVSLVLALGRRVRLWLQVPLLMVVMAAIVPRTNQLCAAATFQQAQTQWLVGAAYQALRWPGWLMPLPGSLLAQLGERERCRWVLALPGMHGQTALCLLLLPPLMPLVLLLVHRDGATWHACLYQTGGQGGLTRPSLERRCPCRCVIGMMQLTLGFWLPLLISVALESRAYQRWKQVQAQQRQQQQQLLLEPEPRAQGGGRRPWGQSLQLRVYREVNAMLDGEDPCGPMLVVMLLLGTWNLLEVAMLRAFILPPSHSGSGGWLAR